MPVASLLWPPVTATGYWLLATGDWRLATGNWPLTTDSTTKVQLRLAWQCYRLVLNLPIGITSKSYGVAQAHWYTAGNLKQRTHERGKPT